MQNKITNINNFENIYLDENKKSYFRFDILIKYRYSLYYNFTMCITYVQILKDLDN